MALNPIDLLRDRVTPQIIDQGDNEASSKSALLDQFYPVLLAYFAHQPNSYDFALKNSNATFSDILPQQTANASVGQLLEEYSRHHNLPLGSIEPLINRSVHLSAKALEQDAGTTSVHDNLSRYLPVIVSAIPAWATTILSSLGLAALFTPYANAAAAAPMPHNNAKQMPVDGSTNDFKKLLPWIGLIVLLLLLLLFWRSCQHKEPLPVAAQPMPVDNASSAMALAPASLALTSGTGNNLLACNANAGDAALSAMISNAAMRVFGNQPTCNVQVDQAYNTMLPGQDKIESILNSVKAIPYASIIWTGDQIVVNAPNLDDTNRLVETIKGIAPELSVIAAPPLDIDQSVNNSISAAQNALSTLRDPVRPEDVVRALNLQIVNFATDSATIPEQNKPVLDHAAKLIRQTPDVALVVEGYTDSTGDAAYNKDLSQKRAQSMIDYLVSQGVNASKLTSMGYGQNNPVADNVTEMGKFRNRRIEFRVTDTQTGNTQHVDEDTAQTSTAEQSVADNGMQVDALDEKTTIIANGSGSAPVNP